MKDKSILILGGDNRSLYLGEFLEKHHFNICYYAFNQTDCYKTLVDAINDCEFIVLPLPFTRDRVTLNAPLFDERVLISDIYALASPEKIFFGGQLPRSFCEELDTRNSSHYDYLLLDEFAIYNAVPTAEGVVMVLIEELPITIHGMRCAVTGYGKVGKVIALTLKALGADVTVFARKEQDFADAFSKSIKCRYISELSTANNDFDALINTVPTKILSSEQLDRLNPDCTLVEIASAPFGIDFQSAKERAFKVVKASSLPGKVAPQSAAEIIGRSILPIIRARGYSD